MLSPTIALRRYRKTATLAATSAVGESKLFLLDYLLRLLRVVVLLAIWRTILPAHGSVAGFTLGAVLTYTLIAEVFAEQLVCTTQVASDLWEGAIAMRMLLPMSLVEHYAADLCGRWLAGLALFSLPLLLCAPLLGVNPLPAGPLAALLFVLSLALAVTIGLAIEFFFLALTVAVEQPVWVIGRMRRALMTLLSGTLLPLALLPWGLGSVFQWLPFASMASAPLQIYTGTGRAGLLLLVQLGWSVVLWPLTLWLWRANREKLVGYGG
jgi:ABC-2 type transport system permease protein